MTTKNPTLCRQGLQRESRDVEFKSALVLVLRHGAHTCQNVYSNSVPGFQSKKLETGVSGKCCLS